MLHFLRQFLGPRFGPPFPSFGVAILLCLPPFYHASLLHLAHPRHIDTHALTPACSYGPGSKFSLSTVAILPMPTSYALYTVRNVTRSIPWGGMVTL